MLQLVRHRRIRPGPCPALFSRAAFVSFFSLLYRRIDRVCRSAWLANFRRWLFYWWYQGLTFTGLWVIAHECGHGGFSDSQVLNDCVGFILHSSLLTPYFSWAITHAKHHHYTNHMTMGETWVPDRANDETKPTKSPLATSIRIAAVAVLGWYFYLLVNATGASANFGQSHFNPRSRALFKPKDAIWVRLSTLGFLCGLGVLGMATRTWGLGEVVRSYLIPQMITCAAARDAPTSPLLSAPRRSSPLLAAPRRPAPLLSSSLLAAPLPSSPPHVDPLLPLLTPRQQRLPRLDHLHAAHARRRAAL